MICVRHQTESNVFLGGALDVTPSAHQGKLLTWSTPFPAEQTKLHVFSIPHERNGEYMELGLFSRRSFPLETLMMSPCYRPLNQSRQCMYMGYHNDSYQIV